MASYVDGKPYPLVGHHTNYDRQCCLFCEEARSFQRLHQDA